MNPLIRKVDGRDIFVASLGFIAGALSIYFVLLPTSRPSAAQLSRQWAPGSCCAKMASIGKTCQHQCCIYATSTGTICAKCHPKPPGGVAGDRKGVGEGKSVDLGG